MKKWIADIKEKTSKMNKKEAGSYIWNYYWYYILGIISIVALILLFGIHYVSGGQKPLFTCVMVNQRQDTARDQKLAETFSKTADISKKKAVIDSEYNFSYGTVKLEGVNESSNEKFFFQWRNKELDAVILSESFLRYCEDLGGEFQTIERKDMGEFSPYEENGKCIAAVLGYDVLTEKLSGEKNEKLLLAFPKTSSHKKSGRAFLEFINNVKKEKIKGITYEEIIS